jgi:N-acylneuraminate cytidylyltransferase
MEVIAFIPVRGGSKSIPMKNIKLLNGKPLVYWVCEALESCNAITQIVVATDSGKIKETVFSFNFPKLIVYDRKPENAEDLSSTESVMLEYIETRKKNSEDDVFMLVQATSPLTQHNHFSEAIDLFRKEKYDSIISCVTFKRFLWGAEGRSINYDYQKRPRRQDFDGCFMENGAFYISSIGNIIKTKNRLFGNIGYYVMPEYSAIEIDEPDDWIIIENLMKRYRIKKNDKKIKAVLSDVDGVLTDSGMYYSENGDELKKFNTRDGVAFGLLKKRGIITGIITSEKNKIIENRAKKINIDYLYQKGMFVEKIDAIKEICIKEKIALEEIAYIGDDINCISALEAVGHAYCPKDASNDVLSLNNITILNVKGGEGVVRELYEKMYS